jgi:DNA-binding LacI/PurR family transcriptional regulator
VFLDAGKDRQDFESNFVPRAFIYRDEVVVYGDFTERSGQGAEGILLDRKNRSTAVFVSNDGMTFWMTWHPILHRSASIGA